MHRTALHTVHMQKHRHDVTQHHQVNKHTHEDVERGKMPLYYRCVELTCFFIKLNEKKRSEETQTLRAGCSKEEPKNFAPPETPFPGAWDGQHLISWRWSLPIPTNPVWWESMHAILSCCGNRPTHPQTRPPTQPHTNRQDQLQYTAPQASAQCNELKIFRAFNDPDLQ